MSANRFKEFVFAWRNQALLLLRIFSFLMALVAFGAFIMYYGFDLDENIRKNIFLVVRSIFGFFLFNFFVRLLLADAYKPFIKDNWFEFILVLVLITDLTGFFLLGIPVLENIFLTAGIHTFTPFYILFIQLYLLLFAGIEILKAIRQIYSLQVSPIFLFFGTFIFLILSGSALLMLPEMTTSPGSMPFLDALFTATSATCVTGLIVVDTATYFTFKGHFVILILMQAGGIGIITFALFFSVFLQKGIGLKQDTVLKEYLNAPNIFEGRKLLNWVVGVTLIIQAFGVASMYYLWEGHVEFERFGERLFFSVFHSVSGFTNSGFTLFTDGFYNTNLQNAFLLHFVTGILIFLGVLGFPVIRELTNFSQLRERMRKPWMDWSINAKISIYSALTIIIVGSIFFWYFERDASMAEMEGAEVLITSVFQIVTRTAGFNTVDIGELARPVLTFLIMAMFIGGASVSVSGGIKTSTFVLMVMAFFSILRRREEIVIGNRTIPQSVLHKAFALFVYATCFLSFTIFLLTLIEPDKEFFDLTFEAVSAFCTVGLSTGITGDLSEAGKALITLTMFFGRLGTLGIVVVLGTAVKSAIVRYPKEELMIG